MTSHSPVAIQELETNELAIVRRSADGTVAIHTLAPDLRDVLRAVPEAFLSARVIVCEGKTEIGVLRALDRAWDETTGSSFAYRGVALVDGGGSNAARRAETLALAGFPTLLVRDSDQPCTPDDKALCAAGVRVLQWEGGVAIEERAFADLPWAAVVQALQIVLEERTAEQVRSAIASRLKIPDNALDLNPARWPQAAAEQSLRVALGKAAKESKPGWFKRVDLGERFGDVIVANLASIPQSGLAQTIGAVKSEVHRDA